MPFITVLQSTENARAGGEFKGLILASTVWYKIFAAGVYVEDLVIRQQEDGTEAVEFREGPTKSEQHHKLCTAPMAEKAIQCGSSSFACPNDLSE